MFDLRFSEFIFFHSDHIVEVFSLDGLTPHFESICEVYRISEFFELIFYIVSLLDSENLTKTDDVRILGKYRINHRIDMCPEVIVYFFGWLWDEKLPWSLSGIASTVVESSGDVLELYGYLILLHIKSIPYFWYLCKYLTESSSSSKIILSSHNWLGNFGLSSARSLR